MEGVADDLVLQILSYLPVKSLVRFRCVCKAWLSLISHPSFVHLHHSRSPPSPPTLFIPPSKLVPSGCLLSVNDATTSRNLPQPPQLPQLTGFPWFCSPSVNGLLCIYERYNAGYLSPDEASFKAMVCNPSRGEFVTLPPTGFSQPEKSFQYQDLSIGFDPCTNTYKILRTFLTAIRGTWPAVCIPHHEILTLGSQQGWRIIDDDISTSHWVGVTSWMLQPGICIDGILYFAEFTWSSCDRPWLDTQKRVTIFHVGEEKFRSIPAPSSTVVDSFSFMWTYRWDNDNCASFETGGHFAIAEFQALDVLNNLLDAEVLVILKLEDSTNEVWSEMIIEMGELIFKLERFQYNEGVTHSVHVLDYDATYFVEFFYGKILYIPEYQEVTYYNGRNPGIDYWSDYPPLVCFDIEKKSFCWKQIISTSRLPEIRLNLRFYLENILSLKELNLQVGPVGEVL